MAEGIAAAGIGGRIGEGIGAGIGERMAAAREGRPEGDH